MEGLNTLSTLKESEKSAGAYIFRYEKRLLPEKKIKKAKMALKAINKGEYTGNYRRQSGKPGQII